jgi:hypothetical protein
MAGSVDYPAKWASSSVRDAGPVYFRPHHVQLTPGTRLGAYEIVGLLVDAEFSPDSRWIAYSSNESGAQEVYVQAFRSWSGAPYFRTGGSDPAWSRDARELFYFRDGGGPLRRQSSAGPTN